MRVRHIEVFHAVYKHKSISAAARALNISQPAMSKALRHAEDQFGFSLFTRTGRGLIPTDEAYRLFEDVQRVFDDIAQVKRTSLDLKRTKGGRLKISTVTGLSFDILPRTITRVRNRQAQSSFEIQTLHYGDLISSLRNFETDIGLVFEAPTHDGLTRLEVGQAEFAVVYSADHMALDAERVSIVELAGYDFVTLNPDGPLGSKLNGALARAEINSNPVAVAESCFVAKSLVACGHGATIVDEFTAHASGFSGLASAKLEPSIAIKVNALYLEARAPTRLGELFLKELGAELKAWRLQQA